MKITQPMRTPAASRRRIGVLLLLAVFPALFLAAAGSTGPAGSPDWLIALGPQPAPPNPQWTGLFGKYGGQGQIFRILEEESLLKMRLDDGREYVLEEVALNQYDPPPGCPLMAKRIMVRRDRADQAAILDSGGSIFARIPIGAEAGNLFRIEPLQPVDALRLQAAKAVPPKEKGPFLTSELVELAPLSPLFKLDIRYATKNNFMGEAFYSQPRAFLQKTAAEALVRVAEKLKPHGYGLMIHDAYRPWSVTKMFWEATPPQFRNFVADPAKGSRHNRGAAVDVTLYDLDSGQALEMGSLYDEFSERASISYPGGSSLERWRRRVLRTAMEAEGFTVYADEWWHYDFKDGTSYPIQNVPFEKLKLKKPARQQ